MKPNSRRLYKSNDTIMRELIDSGMLDTAISHFITSKYITSDTESNNFFHFVNEHPEVSVVNLVYFIYENDLFGKSFDEISILYSLLRE